jgi:hypothetical protein
MDPFLNYAVTVFGFVLSILCFAVIFLGKRIPGDRGKLQQIEFKGFKTKTNTVVTLLGVSAVVAILPLLLQAWLEYKKPDSDQTIYITGQVLDAKGPVEGATVTVTNMKGVRPGEVEDPLPLQKIVTKNSGSFDFPPLPFGQGDRYKVVARKEGHVEQYFYMGPSGAIDVKTVLVAK